MITRTYLSGCEWCNATGIVRTVNLPHQTVSSSLTEVCPVCNGTKVITITETDPDINYEVKAK
jgi:DnaJ-class molecular chaperone